MLLQTNDLSFVAHTVHTGLLHMPKVKSVESLVEWVNGLSLTLNEMATYTIARFLVEKESQVLFVTDSVSRKCDYFPPYFLLCPDSGGSTDTSNQTIVN